MNIVLFASDKKKDLMSNFCNAYSGILSKHTLMATGVTAEVLSRTTPLSTLKFLDGSKGGMEQIANRIRYNEIDMVIALVDGEYNKESDIFMADVLKACDSMNIPVSTNIGTAEILVQGLRHGDLEWREIVRNKK
ncbi:MAG: methylglyoxal synthase [bacterium]|nr:methylglyoxal synthase [bacterium]